MIALRDELPLLAQTGGTVTALSGDWLQHALERAASKAGYGERWWLAPDLARGVVHYLRLHYTETTIRLTRLRQAVRDVLRGIGYQEVARHFRPSPAPSQVDLAKLASGVNNPEEFFVRLAVRLRTLHHAAITDDGALQLHGLEACVDELLLTNHANDDGGGDDDCPALLRARIVHFVRTELLALGWEGVRFSIG